MDIDELINNPRYNAIIKKMLKSSSDLIVIATFSGEFLYLNDAWEKILGWSKEKVINQKYLEYVHPDDIKKTEEINNKNVNGEDIYNFKNRYKSKDGKYKWILWNGLTIPDDKLILGIGRDITELQEKTLKLEKQNSIVNDIMSTGEFAWWEIELKTDEIFISDEKIKILGYDKSELSNKIPFSKYLEMVYSTDQEKLQNLLEEFKKNEMQNKNELEYRIRTKNGDWKWFKSVAEKFKDRELLRGVVFDITIDKENELRLNNLLYSLEDNVTLVSKDGIVMESWTNKKVSSILPESDEIIGKHFAEFLPKELQQEIQYTFRKVLKSERTVEITIPSPIHKNKWVQARIHPVYENGDSSGISRFLILARDATEEIKLKKDLEKKIKELEKVNNLMIDREIKMRELKKKIERLSA